VDLGPVEKLECELDDVGVRCCEIEIGREPPGVPGAELPE